MQFAVSKEVPKVEAWHRCVRYGLELGIPEHAWIKDHQERWWRWKKASEELIKRRERAMKEKKDAKAQGKEEREMGYNSAILINHDRLADIEKDPERFVRELRNELNHMGPNNRNIGDFGAKVITTTHSSQFQGVVVGGNTSFWLGPAGEGQGLKELEALGENDDRITRFEFFMRNIVRSVAGFRLSRIKR